MVILLALLIGISGGLFAERYGVNSFRYKTPAPECDQIQTIRQCLNYPPWARNYENARTLSIGQKKLVGPDNYTASWGNKMVNDFSVVLGRKAVVQPQTVRGPTGDVVARDSLPVIKKTVYWILFAGALITLISRVRLWRRPELRLLIVVSGVYLLILWLQNFSDYRHLGKPDGIQGRYLLLILPFLLALMTSSIASILRLRVLKVGLATVVLAAMMQGGGTASYILRSDPSWYWQNPNVIKLNLKAKQILEPLIKD
jgi:hypothetical protein